MSLTVDTKGNIYNSEGELDRDHIAALRARYEGKIEDLDAIVALSDKIKDDAVEGEVVEDPAQPEAPASPTEAPAAPTAPENAPTPLPDPTPVEQVPAAPQPIFTPTPITVNDPIINS